MKLFIKILIVVLILGLVATIVNLLVIKPRTVEQANSAEATVSRPEVDLSFSYPSGETGLSLIEPPTTSNTALLEAFILMPFADYQAIQTDEPPSESPASISIFVFKETDTEESATITLGTASGTTETATLEQDTASETPRVGRVTRLQNWATDNQNLTSFNQAKNTPEVVDLDGVNALYYEADGLYQQQIYLAAYKGNIYMFVGQYDSPEDPIYQQFKDLMTKVSFN